MATTGHAASELIGPSGILRCDGWVGKGHQRIRVARAGFGRLLDLLKPGKRLGGVRLADQHLDAEPEVVEGAAQVVPELAADVRFFHGRTKVTPRPRGTTPRGVSPHF